MSRVAINGVPLECKVTPSLQISGSKVWRTPVRINGGMAHGITINNYEYPPAFTSAVLYYPGLPGQGATIWDRTGNANNGAITGAVWTRLPGGLSSLFFDGGGAADDLVTVTDATSIQNIFDGAGGSVLGWIKPGSDGEGDAGRIYTKGYWQIYASDEVAGFVKLYFVQSHLTTAGIWRTTSAVVPINVWSLICLTYDADLTTNDPVFYLGTGGAVSTPAVTEMGTPVGARYSDVGLNLIIGNHADTTRTFAGYIALSQLLKGKMITAAEFANVYYQTRHLLGV